jgi:hypothetical protein
MLQRSVHDTADGRGVDTITSADTIVYDHLYLLSGDACPRRSVVESESE